jgi:serpin B
MQAIADANNRFALDLYAKLAADEQNRGKNLFFSPYSVHTALAMTTTGAKANTRDQMVKALHLPADGAKMLAAGDLGRYYGHPRKDYELSVANALWGLKGFPWRPEWLGAQNERFGAGFREADFANNPDGERDRINRWVEEQTRERIKELLVQGQVDRNTRMVLTNAVYFKGAWVTQFDPKRTRPVPFECDDNTRVDVPMMYAKLKVGYTRTEGIEVAELPYRGGELTMVVVLPRRSDDLASLEKKLTPELLAKWLAGLKDRPEIDVNLPKFRVEARYELPKHLQALGMVDAFADGVADFTGMASERPGFIKHVAHKAFVEVSEEGTEAAAATAVVMGVLSGPPQFYANRPFLFLVRDTKRGTVLFLGRVMKP